MAEDKEYSISSFIDKFKKAKAEAQGFVRPLDERTFRRKPSSDKWCIGECFSHLVETGNKYLYQVEKGLRDAKPSNGKDPDPMHLRFHMKWFINYLAPPITFKTKSPGAFSPLQYAKLDKDRIMQDYISIQDRFIERLQYAERKSLTLSSMKVSNPLIPWISMTVAECIAATEAHQRRHLEQAKYTLNLVSETKQDTDTP